MTVATDQVVCARCAAPYRHRLTDGACPVCGTAAPGVAPRRLRRLDDADDRLLAIVVLATIANVLLLAVLAAAVINL